MKSAALSTPAALLLDLDGTLLDTKPAWFATMRRTSRSLGTRPLDDVTLNGSWGQSLEQDAAQLYGGIAPAELEHEYGRWFRECIGEILPMQSAGDLLGWCENRSLKVAVVTNSRASFATMGLGALKHPPSHVFSPTPLMRPKPFPDLLLAACSTFAVDQATVWMVGDTSIDHDAARAAGTTFIGYRTAGSTTIDTLDELIELLAHVTEDD